MTYLSKENKKMGIKVIFTSMIGKKSSLKKLVKILKGIKEHVCVETTIFVQGKTRRWGIAWYYKNDNKILIV